MKKLNCREGNYQCGGKCQRKNYKCPSQANSQASSLLDKVSSITAESEATVIKEEPRLELEGTNKELYEIALGLQTTVNSEDDHLILKPASNVWPLRLNGPDDKFLDKYKKDGVSGIEAMSMTAWFSNFKLMQRAIYSPNKKKKFGDQAALHAANFLHRQPGYKHEDIEAQLKRRLVDGSLNPITYDKPLGEPGQLNRTLSFKNAADSQNFLKQYEEIREKSILACTAYAPNIKGAGYGGATGAAKVIFLITAKADGSGQGKNVEKYREFGQFEGEIIFPPYSKFKVEKGKPNIVYLEEV